MLRYEHTFIACHRGLTVDGPCVSSERAQTWQATPSGLPLTRAVISYHADNLTVFKHGISQHRIMSPFRCLFPFFPFFPFMLSKICLPNFRGMCFFGLIFYFFKSQIPHLSICFCFVIDEIPYIDFIFRCLAFSLMARHKSHPRLLALTPPVYLVQHTLIQTRDYRSQILVQRILRSVTRLIIDFVGAEK